jgi:hypothetical protein
LENLKLGWCSWAISLCYVFLATLVVEEIIVEKRFLEITFD